MFFNEDYQIPIRIMRSIETILKLRQNIICSFFLFFLFFQINKLNEEKGGFALGI